MMAPGSRDELDLAVQATSWLCVALVDIHQQAIEAITNSICERIEFERLSLAVRRLAVAHEWMVSVAVAIAAGRPSLDRARIEEAINASAWVLSGRKIQVLDTFPYSLDRLAAALTGIDAAATNMLDLMWAFCSWARRDLQADMPTFVADLEAYSAAMLAAGETGLARAQLVSAAPYWTN